MSTFQYVISIVILVYDRALCNIWHLCCNETEQPMSVWHIQSLDLMYMFLEHYEVLRITWFEIIQDMAITQQKQQKHLNKVCMSAQFVCEGSHLNHFTHQKSFLKKSDSEVIDHHVHSRNFISNEYGCTVVGWIVYLYTECQKSTCNKLYIKYFVGTIHLTSWLQYWQAIAQGDTTVMHQQYFATHNSE